MSKQYDKIKTYYDTGLWNKTRIKNMVDKNIITKEEYKMITKESYDGK